MSADLVHRPKRLEDALTPATPQILTITVIASATGEIISEHHLTMDPSNQRGGQTRYWREPAQTGCHDRR
jgi:hypothetical protein